jgi:hypothetical protein
LEELRKAVAQIFRHAGKDSLDEKEFKLTASMGLSWFSPAEALLLLKTAKAAGLVEKKGKKIVATFDISKEEVPLDFKPTKKALELPETPLFIKVVDAIVKATGLDRPQVVAKINKKQTDLKVDVRVVALMVARDADVDVTPFLDEAEDYIARIYGSAGSAQDEEDEE